MRPPLPLLTAGLLLAAPLASPAWAQEAEEPPTPTEAARAEKSASLFPLWSEEARRRGAPLPPPYGVGLLAVTDQQGVIGDTLSVRLGKGDAPPADVTLISVPSVVFDNVSSIDSLQVKGDVWVLPFLNVFASVGTVQGEVAVDVVIDLDDLLGPPTCRPQDPCGIKHLYFTPIIDNTVATFGATLVYGSDRWFVALSASRTLSIANADDRSDVESTSAGLRTGLRYRIGDRIRVDPYVGVSYLHLDADVSGVATLNDAFPDGDPLKVRYTAHVQNIDDYSPTIGLNAEIGDHFYVQAEYAHADAGSRFLLTTTWRF